MKITAHCIDIKSRVNFILFWLMIFICWTLNPWKYYSPCLILNEKWNAIQSDSDIILTESTSPQSCHLIHFKQYNSGFESGITK